MNDRDLAHHGLAIKRLAPPAAVAGLMGLPIDRVETIFVHSAATGRAIQANGGYTLTPLARVALDGRYGLHFAGQRTDAGFQNAYENFERINRTLKQVITDWQTISVGGQKVANDHSDKVHDEAVIDRLGGIHEQIEPVIKALAAGLPRLCIYGDKLLAALEAAEDGDHEWVSDIRRDSYHTVWFELHEDLLRIMGRVREE